VFHSFRHTFASALQQAGAQEAIVALIMGHKHKSITFGRYGGKLVTPKDKLAVMKDVEFGVNLSHLMKR
jgi:integrase